MKFGGKMGKTRTASRAFLLLFLKKGLIEKNGPLFENDRNQEKHEKNRPLTHKKIEKMP